MKIVYIVYLEYEDEIHLSYQIFQIALTNWPAHLQYGNPS